MTTGNTTLLGLALPVEGELDGTWGDVVNDSITSLLDSAVAGTTTLSADADVTLTTTVLAANQARQAILRWTASNGATTRNITAPAQSKPYIVINAGTGSIVLRGAGPTTGITIVSGERCLAAWSGSDFVKVASTAISNLSGILAAANGGTGLSSAGTAGNVLTSTGTAWASSALPAGGLTYIFTTTPVTATDKQGVLTSTAGGSFTVTLPATPSVGAQVVVADAGASWGTNNLTVARNGSTIGGLAENLICDINGASVQFVYDGTSWEVYAQIGGNGGTVVTLAGVQTLTNKTITFADNTLTGVAGTTATQTLTNKTIEAGTFTNGYTEETVTANTGTAYTISLANGTVQYLTLTGNVTYTFPTPVAGQSFILIQRQDGTGGRTVTWPATVDWPGATAPTLTSTANRVDKFVFTAIDGSNWLGSNAGQNYTV
jgi:hypothetical protein